MDRTTERILRINEQIMNSNQVVAEVNCQIFMQVRARRNNKNVKVTARNRAPPAYNSAE